MPPPQVPVPSIPAFSAQFPTSLSLVPSLQADPRYDQGGSSGRQRQEHPQHHHASAAATAAEVKQKAAKMLHAGTQWFMRASKTLVKDLQTGIARHQAQQRTGGPGLGWTGLGWWASGVCCMSWQQGGKLV